MKKLFVLFTFLSIVSCKNNSKEPINQIHIDKSIIKEVKSHISESDIIPSEGKTIYDNTLIVDRFEDNSLVESANGQNKVVFASFFYNSNDTIIIDGLYGVFQGFGFSIQIKDNNSTIFHLLETRKRPSYSLKPNDNLEYRIEVPCINTKLTLSKIPHLKDNEIVYGAVEFESLDYYYQENYLPDTEAPKRTKVKMKMKVYFKSMYIDFSDNEN